MNPFASNPIDEPTGIPTGDLPEFRGPTMDHPFEAFARFYDHDYRHYDDDVEMLLALAHEQDGLVLELGCGTGRLLAPLASAGHNVVGVDISPALLDVAQWKLDQLDLASHVQLVQADLRDFQIDNERFAFAFCTSNTLMHLTSPADQLVALQNAHRHLDTDGLLLIDLFNPDVQRLTQVQGIQELADQMDRRANRRAGDQVVRTDGQLVGAVTGDTLRLRRDLPGRQCAPHALSLYAALPLARRSPTNATCRWLHVGGRLG